MVFREVSVIEIREALRAWLAGKSERAVAAQAGVDRKTSRRYVRAAVAAGGSREGGEGQLTDELIGQVVSVARPVRPDGHGQGWAELEARQEEIAAWVKGGVPVVKIGILLARQGVVVAERTLHRFAAERCGAGGGEVTTPVDDGPPGSQRPARRTATLLARRNGAQPRGLPPRIVEPRAIPGGAASVGEQSLASGHGACRYRRQPGSAFSARAFRCCCSLYGLTWLGRCASARPVKGNRQGWLSGWRSC